MREIIYHPIGLVENGFMNPGNPKEMRNSPSKLIIDERYAAALEGLDGFKHALVIYHLDRSPGYREKVHPMGDTTIPKRGVLATRSPCRPNPLAVTLVEILEVSGNRITVRGLDALNGTPLLDIKPYEEHFDSPQGILWENDPGYQPVDRKDKSY
jgi:tRNA-Thr(GGU) m(6)t(6)A37 methyltransferase TsaA